MYVIVAKHNLLFIHKNEIHYLLIYVSCSFEYIIFSHLFFINYLFINFMHCFIYFLIIITLSTLTVYLVYQVQLDK